MFLLRGSLGFSSAKGAFCHPCRVRASRSSSAGLEAAAFSGRLSGASLCSPMLEVLIGSPAFPKKGVSHGDLRHAQAGHVLLDLERLPLDRKRLIGNAAILVKELTLRISDLFE